MTKEEVRARVDEVVRRLDDDEAFRSQMEADPEGTLMGAGFGEEAAVILGDDWMGATGHGLEMRCQINNSCRFTDSLDPCGPTATTLRGCG